MQILIRLALGVTLRFAGTLANVRALPHDSALTRYSHDFSRVIYRKPCRS